MAQKKLSPRAIKFVDEYLVDLCAKDAAIRAGYSSKAAQCAGSRLLADERVQQLLARRMEARAARVEVKQDEVILGLREELAKAATPIVVRVRIWELLGKHCGMFSDRVHVTGTVTVIHRRELLGRVSAALAAVRHDVPALAAPVAQA
jgi:phage terminase small subunit